MTKPPEWAETLDDLDRRRQHALAMGGPDRLDKHRGNRQARRARADRSAARPRHLPRDRHAGRRRDRGRRASSPGSGLIDGRRSWWAPRTSPRWPARIGPAAIPSDTASPNWRCATRSRWSCCWRARAFGPPVGITARTPTDLLMPRRAARVVSRPSRRVLGPSAGHGALVGPVCDFRLMSAQGAIFTAGPPVVRESTGEDVYEGRSRRPGRRRPQRGDPQRRRRRRRRARATSAATCPTSRRAPGRTRPAGLDSRHGPRRRRSCSTSCRATTAASTTCAPVLDVIVDRPDWFEIQPRFGRGDHLRAGASRRPSRRDRGQPARR